MKIAFVHLDSFFPPAHGGAHMIKCVAEGLARLGHTITAYMPVESSESPDRASSFAAQTIRNIRNCVSDVSISASETVRFQYNGVSYSGVRRDSDRFFSFVVSELTRTGVETVVLTDVGGVDAHLLLNVIQDNYDGKVIYYPMTIHMLPGGPDALSPDEEAAERVRRCTVLTPSQHAADYIQRHLGVRARQCLPPMFTLPRAAPPRFGGSFTLFNPSDWKGLPILLTLADERPDLKFVVKPSWATIDRDTKAVSARRNIELRRNSGEDKSAFYGASSVVLVPSLCNEALGLVVIEAMLHGVPVVASDHGGLREAKLGVPFLVPINPIRFHHGDLNVTDGVRQEVPQQDISRWLNTVDLLAGDSRMYSELSKLSRDKAEAFVRTLDWESVESCFT